MGVPLVGLFGDLERRFVDVLDRVSDAIVALDRDWRLVYINQAAEKHFGVPRDQLLGKICWDLFPETVGSPDRRAVQAGPGGDDAGRVRGHLAGHEAHRQAEGLPVGSGVDDLLPRRLRRTPDGRGRKRAERAMSLLADAGEELSLSLERDEIVRRLTALVVPTHGRCLHRRSAGGRKPDPGGGQAAGRARTAGAFANVGTGTGHSDRVVGAAELGHGRRRGACGAGRSFGAAGPPAGARESRPVCSPC